ncbi:RsbRD N-terminal domain-containing protein [Desulfitibacter alkalitolerans]|uniref:RsbRD N-terminal domain-containing protein n=1 Tax=Desulfitibacter alkalitolerans TaxID=264641 RepID=UPI000556D5DD|nr:RsbRD N-terminal domain-containing protein [Desulfitibacter alkalitolerans]
MTQVPDVLKGLLADKKAIIVSKWFHNLCQEYPDKTVKHLKSGKSQFANPVGHNLRQGLDGIFDQVLEDVDSENFRLNLDRILRIKAVQDFSPSQAIAFIFILKKLIREELQGQLDGEVLYKELAVIEQRIDNIALVAFEIYLQCKETIYQLRIDEVKRKCAILERINMLNQGPAAIEYEGSTQ